MYTMAHMPKTATQSKSSNAKSQSRNTQHRVMHRKYSHQACVPYLDALGTWELDTAQLRTLLTTGITCVTPVRRTTRRAVSPQLT